MKAIFVGLSCLVLLVSASPLPREDSEPSAAPARRVSIPIIGGDPAFDTSRWIGAEYTPSPAGNQLWFAEYFQVYQLIVRKELSRAVDMYGFTAFRVFLHNMLYDHDKNNLYAAIDDLLSFSASIKVQIGFVFFDDCWNHSGATYPDSCKPVKGRHNGCWMASPQDVDRTNVTRFESYVTETVTRYKTDTRVAWWEIFNEPQKKNAFSMELRNAGFNWATAVKPIQPVISCWDDNPDTQIVDFHAYDTNFPRWTEVLYSNPSKGALITEAGSRWWQNGTKSGDEGSVKTVINYLSGLQLGVPAPVPYVPGAMISWELMVGNSNTRWHWNTPDNTPEPVIPWDAHMFPDYTPISYTEAKLIKHYITSKSDFLFVDTFMTPRYDQAGNQFLTVNASSQWDAPLKQNVSDGIFEFSIWPEENGIAGVMLRTSTDSRGHITQSYFIGLDVTNQRVLVQRRVAGIAPKFLATYDSSHLDCKMVAGAWNMLRVVLQGNKIDVYLNPMYIDAITPQGIQPRVSVTDDPPLPAGGVSFLALSQPMRVDYVSVLPVELL